ncbi:hypothetical protein BCON_0067g00170 [Botryotinia convoluta]|uniref:Uncharacterized protein n=1 Tax=Botryotinia convoluta TaxID=54673 RepID=A0A4Z1I766_9HELO|nr:hypothetical protein BCON_0067g00170 [Botryotinia convoluta]
MKSRVSYMPFQSPEARINVQYFINHGLHDTADLIFISNGEIDIHKIISAKNNIKRTRSMFWAAYSLKMKTQLFSSQDVLTRLPRQLANDIILALDESEKYTPGINNCFRSFSGAISVGIGAAASVNAAGYGIEAIMSAVNRVGGIKDQEESKKKKDGHHGHLHKGSGKHVAEKQDKLSDIRREYERLCTATKMGDVLIEGPHLGINVNPFETGFIKTNRYIDPVALEKLRNWMKGSKFTSYDHCKS